MWNFKNTITGTLTGVRISAVDGTAFLDNCAALVPYMDGRSRIQLLDASGSILEGVLGLRGTGETIGGELLDSWTNYLSSFETLTVSGSDIIQAVNNSSYGLAFKQYSGIYIGRLMKCVQTTYTLNSGTEPGFGLQSGLGINIPMTKNGTSYVTHWSYGNCNISLYVNANSDFSFTGTSVKQVLTPSNQGCLIKNDSGVQNFISKNVSFTYNAASYTYKLFTNVRI
jgi:hypothetical protein